MTYDIWFELRAPSWVELNSQVKVLHVHDECTYTSDFNCILRSFELCNKVKRLYVQKYMFSKYKSIAPALFVNEKY